MRGTFIRGRQRLFPICINKLIVFRVKPINPLFFFSKIRSRQMNRKPRHEKPTPSTVRNHNVGSWRGEGKKESHHHKLLCLARRSRAHNRSSDGESPSHHKERLNVLTEGWWRPLLYWTTTASRRWSFQKSSVLYLIQLKSSRIAKTSIATCWWRLM